MCVRPFLSCVNVSVMLLNKRHAAEIIILYDLIRLVAEKLKIGSFFSLIITTVIEYLCPSSHSKISRLGSLLIF